MGWSEPANICFLSRDIQHILYLVLYVATLPLKGILPHKRTQHGTWGVSREQMYVFDGLFQHRCQTVMLEGGLQTLTSMNPPPPPSKKSWPTVVGQEAIQCSQDAPVQQHSLVATPQVYTTCRERCWPIRSVLRACEGPK